MNSNQLTSTNKNAKVALRKSKSLLNITNQILSKKEDNKWIEEFWKWADENEIDNKTLPRNKTDLLNLKKLELYLWPNELNNTILRYICRLSRLEDLALDTNANTDLEVTNIFLNLSNLHLLKKLSLGFYNTEGNHNTVSISKEISYLKFLENLSLSCRLISIPMEITKLKKLKILDIEFCELPKGIPLEIFKLTTLESLNCLESNVIKLSSRIGNLVNLKYLQLSDCELVDIPVELKKLNKLEYLGLSGNKINLDKLCNLIKNFNNLKQLDIDEIENFQSLHILGEIKSLNYVSIDESFYKDIDKVLKILLKLPHLKSLNLDSKKLNKFPYLITKFHSIKELNLYNNNINELPYEIGEVNSLNELRIHNNCLTRLPSSIVNLNNLNHFSIHNNKELVLTNEQKDWITKLKNKGCTVYIEDKILL